MNLVMVAFKTVTITLIGLKSVVLNRTGAVSPHRLAWSRTPPFHGGNRGSNPLGDANIKTTQIALAVWVVFVCLFFM